MPRAALDIRLDMSQADHATRDILADISPKGKHAAIARAMNKTLTGLRTDIVRAVRDRFNIKAKEIRSRIAIKRATARQKNPNARLTVRRGRRMPLSTFAPRPSKPVSMGGRRPKKGVSFKVLTHGPRRVLPGSFLQKTRHGINILKRVGPEREPVHIKYGASFMSVLQAAGTEADLQSKTDLRFLTNLRREALFGKGRERGRV